METEKNDPDKLAGELEGEAKELEHKLETLDHEISEVRNDWMRKREQVAPGDEAGEPAG